MAIASECYAHDIFYSMYDLRERKNNIKMLFEDDVYIMQNSMMVGGLAAGEMIKKREKRKIV